MNKLMLNFIRSLVGLLTGGFTVRDIAQAINEVLMTAGAADVDHLVLKKAVVDAEARVSALSDVVAKMGEEGLRLADKLRNANQRVAYLEAQQEVPNYQSSSSYLASEWGGNNRLPLIKYLRAVSGVDLKTAREAGDTLIGIINVLGGNNNIPATMVTEMLKTAATILTSASAGIGHYQEEKAAEFLFGSEKGKCVDGKNHRAATGTMTCGVCGISSRYHK